MLPRLLKYCIILAVAFIASCSSESHFDWEERYRENGMYPYDLGVLHQLLEETEDGLEILTNNFSRKIKGVDSANFLQIGKSIDLDTFKIKLLKDFVYKGNKAFLISNNIPYQLLYQIYDSAFFNYGSAYSTNITVNFSNDKAEYNFDYKYNEEATAYGWGKMWCGYLESDSAMPPEPLSYINDTSVNYFKIQYGKGAFYFHCSPIMFTNYQLKRANAFEHAQKVFSHLNEGKILWDNSYRYLQIENRKKDESSTSPLKLMFSHKSLKWGWFLFLFSALLFVLFKSKREQRIIPIMAINRNESIEFAKNVGNLYFKNGGHGQIADEMYQNFLHEIRTHYQIDTNKEGNEIFAQLAKKSGIDKSSIDELFDKFKLRFSDYGQSKELIDLYNLLDKFYKNRK